MRLETSVSVVVTFTDKGVTQSKRRREDRESCCGTYPVELTYTLSQDERTETSVPRVIVFWRVRLLKFQEGICVDFRWTVFEDGPLESLRRSRCDLVGRRRRCSGEKSQLRER